MHPKSLKFLEGAYFIAESEFIRRMIVGFLINSISHLSHTTVSALWYDEKETNVVWITTLPNNAEKICRL